MDKSSGTFFMTHGAEHCSNLLVEEKNHAAYNKPTDWQHHLMVNITTI